MFSQQNGAKQLALPGFCGLKKSTEGLFQRLLNDILDYSKIEQGYVKLEKIPGDFPATIGLMYDAFYSRASSREVNLVRKIDTNLHPCYLFDSVRIRQVIANLLSNAIKFTHHGYVELVVELLERRESSDLVFAAVRDTGIGVALEKQNVIFESFKQAEESTTRKYGGSGLGLAISRHLVGLMGGTISIRSPIFDKPDAPGSEFSFRLELTRCNPSEIRVKEESEPSRSTGVFGR